LEALIKEKRGERGPPPFGNKYFVGGGAGPICGHLTHRGWRGNINKSPPLGGGGGAVGLAVPPIISRQNSAYSSREKRDGVFSSLTNKKAPTRRKNISLSPPAGGERRNYFSLVAKYTGAGAFFF